MASQLDLLGGEGEINSKMGLLSGREIQSAYTDMCVIWIFCLQKWGLAGAAARCKMRHPPWSLA